MATVKDIIIPQTGGTDEFSYSCDCATSVTFSYPAIDWATVTIDTTNKKVIISANTSSINREFVITPIVNSKSCDGQKINVKQIVCDCDTLKLDSNDCLIWEADEYSVSSTRITIDVIINSGACHTNIQASVTNGFSNTLVGNMIRIAPTNANTSSTPLTGTLEVSYDYKDFDDVTHHCTKTMPMYQFGTKKYLRFEPRSTCRFKTNVTASTTYYSDDCGVNWKELNTQITVEPCRPILLKATGTTYRGTSATTYDPGKPAFTTSGTFAIKGNIMSLLYGDDFEDKTTLPSDNTFNSILAESSVYDASELILPATALTEGCYRQMFEGSSNLKTVPNLPATTMATKCYYEMFQRCTSLTSIPSGFLPATTLKEDCYAFMFQNCSGLTSIPSDLLPATTLEEDCYLDMFSFCTSLTTVPELPATTLAQGCYQNMFQGCKSLTSIPSNLLPAKRMTENCYQNMFANCSGVTSIPSDLLPATTLAKHCYDSMFASTSITDIPSGLTRVTSLADYCYKGMFQGCTSLTTVPSSMLPATALTEGCYESMFSGCTSLTTVPSNLLPATTLAKDCYHVMFDGCTSLTKAPDLPATTLKDECYWMMFQDCTNLNYIKCLATGGFNASRYADRWVRGVQTSSGTFVKPSSVSEGNWGRGESGIPNNWTVQNA